MAVILVAGGGFLLYLRIAPWAWIEALEPIRVTAREVIPGIGEALIIAGILALAVDPFLKAKLIEEFAKDVFGHMVGFSHVPEIKAKIQEIAFGTNFYQRHYDLRLSIEPRAGGVSITATKKLQIINQTLDAHNFKPGWAFTEADNIRNCRVKSFIDGQDATESNLNVANKNGYAQAYADAVSIEPERNGKKFSFQAECMFDAPNDYYHPMYFEYPTMGVDITVEAPDDGWKVWIGGQARQARKTVFHNSSLYMPGDKVEIHWRKADQSSVSKSRTDN